MKAELNDVPKMMLTKIVCYEMESRNIVRGYLEGEGIKYMEGIFGESMYVDTNFDSDGEMKIWLDKHNNSYCAFVFFEEKGMHARRIFNMLEYLGLR